MTGIDLHQQITDRIVAAIETAGKFKLPCTRCTARPVNISSRAPYNGVNVLSLWVAALDNGYPSNLWGTYKQWLAAGCQVRKGEKGTLVVLYRKIETEDEDQERLIARASWVFNAAQVDGYQAPALPIPFDPIPSAETFVAATGARIKEGGDRACYVPSRDLIRMPDRGRFVDREAFYATLCHELVHWSGADTRLARDLSGRFGDAVKLGPGNVDRDGVLSFLQSKTGDMAYVPWTCELPAYAGNMGTDRDFLHAALDARSEKQMTFLATEQGMTRSDRALGTMIRLAAREAGIAKSAHGLRKCRAVLLADAGATTHQIGAWTGHHGLKEVEHYTLRANRRRAVMGTGAEQKSAN